MVHFSNIVLWVSREKPAICFEDDLPFCNANCSLLSLCCFADLEVGLLVCSAVVAAEPGTEEEDLRAMGWAYSLPVVASATITGTLLPTGVPTSPPATANVNHNQHQGYLVT